MKTAYVITKEIFTGEYSQPKVEYTGVYVGNDIKGYLENLSGHKIEKSSGDGTYYTGVAYDYYYYAHKTKIIEG